MDKKFEVGPVIAAPPTDDAIWWEPKGAVAGGGRGSGWAHVGIDVLVWQRARRR